MNDIKNKKVYIVLTFTGTALSRLVRFYTNKPYSHVSIALDSSLKEMYSFGRLNPYNPFIGGFIKEEINSGTFKRFSNTEAKIYSINLTRKQYRKIKSIIRKFSKNRNKYGFNILGLFLVSLNIRLKRNNLFYCAEFVKYVLDYSEIKLDLPEIIKPMDFIDEKLMNLEYMGLLRNY